MGKVILEGYILVRNNDLNAVIAALAGHIKLTRQEQGCLLFEVTQDSGDKNRFNVYEVFSNQTAFEFHQARVRHSVWGTITKDVERHYQVSEQPEISL